MSITDVILKTLPVIAIGIDDNTITYFISKLPSNINAYITDNVNNDMTDLIPLHSSATSKDPAGVFNKSPSISVGIPSMFAKFEDAIADVVWIGDATMSTNGKGIANNKNDIGNFILPISFHPYKYSIIPKITITNDNPERNLTT